MKLSALVLCAACAAAPALSAGPMVYTVMMNGVNEVPTNDSPATGSGFVILDTTARTLYITFSFTGLVGTTIGAHIHCCTLTPNVGGASVATQTPAFSGFPLGVKSGSFTNTFDLTLASTYRPAFVKFHGGSVAASESALITGAAEGKAYLNIHTTAFEVGEIRGFLTPVPEPATFALGGLALAGLAILRRRHV